MKSLWQHNSQLPLFEPLKGDISTDVLVIGGGLAGLLCAYRLKEAGIDSAVVERDKICSHTTAHTTAKITSQHGLCFQKIFGSYGKEFAEGYYKANEQAAESLKNLCRKHNCSFEQKDNYVYCQDRYKIEKELEVLKAIGVNALYKENVPLPLLSSGAVGFQDQAQFNPLELIKKISKGLKIYENTRVTEMIGTTAVTDRGRIKAKKVVVCTHFPFINKHGSYFLKLYQHRSYILALKNAEDIKDMYVDNDKKGLSFSTYDGLLLLGGGGHRTGNKGGSFSSLEKFREEHYPLSKEIFRWSAQDTISLDSIPYIGRYSKNTPDLYVATGFNKWGVTSSMLSAEIIKGEITGKISDFAPIFSPQRSILKPQLMINGLESLKNLLTPTPKRCPHLGCALKYNKAEHSWDCPCHGSRFDEKGRVIEGPANGDIVL